MRSAASPEGGPRSAWLFCHEGDFWTIAYGGRLMRLKDAKGLRYLAHLLRHPGRRFHVSELVAVVGGRRGQPNGQGATERAPKAVTNRVRQSVSRASAPRTRGSACTSAMPSTPGRSAPTRPTGPRGGGRTPGY